MDLYNQSTAVLYFLELEANFHQWVTWTDSVQIHDFNYTHYFNSQSTQFPKLIGPSYIGPSAWHHAAVWWKSEDANGHIATATYFMQQYYSSRSLTLYLWLFYVNFSVPMCHWTESAKSMIPNCTHSLLKFQYSELSNACPDRLKMLKWSPYTGERRICTMKERNSIPCQPRPYQPSHNSHHVHYKVRKWLITP